jgi:hypothetical protein
MDITDRLAAIWAPISEKDSGHGSLPESYSALVTTLKSRIW